MNLADHEKQSPVWLKIKAHYEERLALLRAQNDGPLDEEKTLTLRGRIAEVKALLDLGNDKPTMNT